MHFEMAIVVDEAQLAKLVHEVSWSRLSEQLFRVDKWSVCRG
jgi:hypothetical protein